MNYLNLEIADINSEKVKGSDPVERGTWLMLQSYCAEQENGGRIEACREWKDRKWQQLAAVTLKEVQRECDLWTWDGDDLLVWGYPVEQEAEVQQRRVRARENGLRGGRPKKPTSETQKKPTLVPTSEPTSESVKERKEKEGKEKEVPPNPQGGGERRVLPERWRNIPKQDRKNHRVLHNNRLMQRIGAWFARKPETLWTLAEGIALHDINPSPEDIDLLESYYLASITKAEDYRRRDLLTLLNNWAGELDRARIWNSEQ